MLLLPWCLALGCRLSIALYTVVSLAPSVLHGRGSQALNNISQQLSLAPVPMQLISGRKVEPCSLFNFLNRPAPMQPSYERKAKLCYLSVGRALLPKTTVPGSCPPVPVFPTAGGLTALHDRTELLTKRSSCPPLRR